MTTHSLLSAEFSDYPYKWSYLNASERVAATGFVATDVGRLALQTDNYSLWVLSAVTPTWVEVAGSGSSDLPFTSITDPAVDAAVTTVIIDANSGTVITLTAPGNSQTLADPTDTTAGRKFFVMNNDTSNNSIPVNGVTLAAGQYAEFRWDGTAWLFTAGGAAGGPGGANTEIQYNDSGVLAGDAGNTWDKTAKRQKIIGDIKQARGEVGNLYSPVQVSSTPLGTAPRYSVPQGNYTAVIDSGSDNLRILDTTDPLNIVVLGSVLVGNARGLDWAGRYACVVETNNDNFHVIDLIDVSNPVIVSTLALTGAFLNPRGVRIRGSTVFVTNNTAGPTFIAVDITDPTQPAQIGSLDLLAGAKVEFDVVDNVAYVITANSTESIVSIDVSDPANWSAADKLDTVAIGISVEALRANGGYLYVVDETSRKLFIYDRSDPTNLTLTGEVLLTAAGTYSPRIVDVQFPFAYVVGVNSNVMVVVDVSDPTTPVVISNETAIGNNPVSLAVTGRYAQITDNGADAFLMVDVGGADLQNINVGSIDASGLNVRGNIKAGGVLSGQSLGVGFSGIYSDGAVVAEGYKLGPIAQNVRYIRKEDDFDIVGSTITLLPGWLYLLLEDVSTDKTFVWPDSGTTFNPAVIMSSNKYGNRLTSTGTGAALFNVVDGEGQVGLENIRIENTGDRPFATLSGLNQTSVTFDFDHCDIVGFSDGTKFERCFFFSRNLAFWQDCGTFEFIDCDCALTDTFQLDNVDTNAPILRVASSSPTATDATRFEARDCDLSSQANQAFFMFHSNLTTASTIRISGIEINTFTPGTGDFYATETGSISALADSGGAPGVRTLVTSNGHTVKDGDTVLISGFTSATQMNGTFTASNVVLNQFEVVAVFTTTDTGTWANASLDQDSVLVNAFSNPGQEDSRAIGSMYVSGNATATVIASANTWTDLDLGTAVESSNTSRWSLTNTTTGELTYQGVEPFSGTLFASISGTGAGGTSEYHFRAVKNGTVLTDAVEAVIDVGSAVASASLVVPVFLMTANDTVRLQVENVDSSSNFTVSHVSVSIQ